MPKDSRVTPRAQAVLECGQTSCSTAYSPWLKTRRLIWCAEEDCPVKREECICEWTGQSPRTGKPPGFCPISETRLLRFDGQQPFPFVSTTRVLHLGDMALDAIIHRKETAWWRQFQQAPCPTLAKTLYSWRRRLALEQTSQQAPEAADDITVVCVSDTHNSQPKIPPGDILIHAGDLTQGGTAAELQTQLYWLDAQPHAHKFVIAGNHDIILDAVKSVEFGFPSEARKSLQWGSLIYLEHSSWSVEVRERTVSVFGHPSTRKHGNWAFQYDKGTDVFRHQVPMDVDILITHSAPQFHLDVAGWGEIFLLREIERVKPKLHVFGHIHGGYGQDILVYDAFERLYEDICSQRGGMLAVLHMAYLLLRMIFIGLPRNAERTMLINASAVEGLCEESIRNVQTVRL